MYKFLGGCNSVLEANIKELEDTISTPSDDAELDNFFKSYFQQLIQDCRVSEKFLLPLNGNIPDLASHEEMLHNAQAACGEKLKLPYQKLALEFPLSDSESDARQAIFVLLVQENETEIITQAFFKREDEQEWHRVPGVYMIIEKNTLNTNIRFNLASPVYQEHFTTKTPIDQVDGFAEIGQVTTLATYVVCQFLIDYAKVLKLGEIGTFEATAEQKQEQKESGGEPLFTYKILPLAS